VRTVSDKVVMHSLA